MILPSLQHLTATNRWARMWLTGWLFFSLLSLVGQDTCRLGEHHWQAAWALVGKQPEQAIEAFERAATVYRTATLADSVCWDRYLFSYVGIAICLRSQGELALLTEYEASAILPYLSHGTHTYQHLPRLLLFLGSAHKDQWHYDQAISYFSQAAQIARQMPNGSAQLAEAYNNLALIYQEQGDFQQAYQYYLQSESLILQQDPDSSRVQQQLTWASLRNNIGLLFRNQMKPQLAIPWFERAVYTLERPLIKDYEPVTKRRASLLRILYINLGKALVELEEPEAAIDYLYKALAAKPTNKQRATIHKHLASAFLDLENQEGGRKHIDTAISLREQIFPGKHVRKALTYEVSGNLYHARQQYAPALEAYQQALLQFTNTYEGDDPLALPPVEDLTIEKEILPLLEARGKCLQEGYAPKGDLDMLTAASANYQLAIEVLMRMRGSYRLEGSKLFWQARTLPIFEAAIQTALELASVSQDPTYRQLAFQLSETGKALLLAESLQVEQKLAEQVFPDHLVQGRRRLLMREAYLENQVLIKREQSQAANEELAELLSQLGLIRDSLEAVNAQLGQLDPAFLAYAAPTYQIDLPTLQAKLAKRKGQLISYFLGESQLFTFSLTGSELKVNHQNIPAAFDTTLTQLLRLAQQDQGLQTEAELRREVQAFATQSHQLYEWLLAKVLRPEMTEVVIVPDGRLGLLPFDALLTSLPAELTNFRALPYLLRTHTIHMAFSAHFWLHPGRVPRSEASYLGFAPHYQENLSLDSLLSLQMGAANRLGLSPLIYHTDEVKEVQGQWAGQALLGKVATKAAFEQDAPGHQILHLAMHAFANEAYPALSGMIFTPQAGRPEGYILFAYEIRRLGLPVELVILSACNTGTGQVARGEGIISLARAFKQAGSTNILMTLWQINDRSTNYIIKAFSEQLAEGMPRAAALRQAKLAYLDRASIRAAHPRYWAAFTLVGTNDPMSNSSSLWGWILGIGLGFLVLGGVGYALYRRKRKR